MADQADDAARDAALIAELDAALATARQQQAALRSSLAAVTGFLDQQTG